MGVAPTLYTLKRCRSKLLNYRTIYTSKLAQSPFRSILHIGGCRAVVSAVYIYNYIRKRFIVNTFFYIYWSTMSGSN